MPGGTMRSNTNGSTATWLLSQINWGFFVGPKGLMMIILAISGVVVWLSVCDEDPRLQQWPAR